ncbi:MAG TPA: HAMP domain-containing sensor histidine kinase [Anaeromyxobacteraceae bacterium]|nr:HAMP domain-containing sensor histidine kinase [Anaeromyxobacteraceae bacterium]
MALTTHEFLTRERDRIMAEWERAIHEEPRPIKLEESALRNDLPEFLVSLAAWMRTSDAPLGGMLEGVPTTHAKQRLKHAYELAQLISEFRVLRATILRLLLLAEAEEQDRTDTHEARERRVSELARLNAGLDQAISDSVEYFVQEREHVRERFIGVLGHDLRAPLSAIVMSADHMLRSGQLQPGLDRAAGRIARNAARMSRMVRDLLDLARGRLGEGIPVNTTSRIDMGEVCHAAAEDASLTQPDREITVKVSGDLWGNWDRDRALQAVANLLSNALLYGDGPVVVSATCVGDDAVVQVTNQGEPISEDGISKLFDPFQRGEAGAGAREGLGLGLYIVSEIMRAHGGTVAAESSPEHGTTFTLTWPRSRCARAD